MLNGLDLFSGIGGLTIALEGIVRPVAYCENDRYAQAVLLSRMSDGSLPVAPIWDDIKTLNADELQVPVDIVYGGFPCQDISVAGRKKGLAGERSGLFFEIIRLVCELRPQFIFVDGECFELMTWERRISENDGGVLPTPVAYDATPGGPNNHYQGLGQMAKKQQWPTPMASQASRGDCPADRRRKTPGLESAVKMETLEFGKLNPTWVEWLMGYDLEWTALKDWAMQWCLSKRGKMLISLLTLEPYFPSSPPPTLS